MLVILGLVPWYVLFFEVPLAVLAGLRPLRNYTILMLHVYSTNGTSSNVLNSILLASGGGHGCDLSHNSAKVVSFGFRTMSGSKILSKRVPFI